MDKLNNLSEHIRVTAAPEIQKLLDELELPFGKGNLYTELPDPEAIDLSEEALAGLVTLSSNRYGEVSRISGMIGARKKIVKRAFDTKFKLLAGESTKSNQAAREAEALEQCSQEEEELTLIESLESLITPLENSTRVASESSRKLLDKLVASKVASNRSF